MVSEGATLDILPNGAAFITSGLTGKPYLLAILKILQRKMI